MRAKLIGQSPEYYKLYEILRKLERFTQLAPYVGWNTNGTTSNTTTIPPEQQAALLFIQRVEEDGGVTEAEACLISDIKSLIDAGIWNNASAVWQPYGYAESKLYATKGGSGVDLGYTRAGTRYRTGPSLVEPVPYNLVPQSRIITNAAWTKTNIAAAADVATAPDGTNTAYSITESVSANLIHSINSSVSVVTGSQYRVIAYAKQGTGTRYIQLAGFGAQAGNEAPVFNLINGTVTLAGTSVVTKSATITSLGDGWYLCEAVFEASSSSITNPTIGISRTIQHGADTWTGDGVSSILLWGVQVTNSNITQEYFNTTNRFNVPAIDYTRSNCPVLSVEPARTNIILQSEDFSTTWINSNTTEVVNAITAPNGLLTADSILETAVNNTHTIQQNVSKAGIPLVYTISVHVKPNGRDWIVVELDDTTSGAFAYFNITTGTIGNVNTFGISPFTSVSATIIASKNGFYKITLTATSNTSVIIRSMLMSAIGNGTNSFLGDITKGFYAWGAQLEQGSYATSYIPTTTGSVSRIADSIPILLPKGTNQVLQSQTFNNAIWVKGNATVTADSTNDPNGFLTADRLLETVFDGIHYTTQGVAKPTVAMRYSWSVYVKMIGRTWACISISNNAGTEYVRRWMELSGSGSLGSTISGGTTFILHDSNIEAVGNDWYRLRIVATSNAEATVYPQIIVASADGVISYPGDITKGFYIWGAQLEQGDETTTYVATTTVPRHNGVVIGQTEGTLFFDGYAFADSITKEISLTAGSSSNRITISFLSSNVIRGHIATASTTQFNVSNGGFSSNTRYKIALVYSNNYAALFVNGAKIGEDLTVTVPACNQIEFNDGDATSPIYGDIINLSILPIALSDAELIVATTI